MHISYLEKVFDEYKVSKIIFLGGYLIGFNNKITPSPQN
jgi:hypothetical protein